MRWQSLYVILYSWNTIVQVQSLCQKHIHFVLKHMYKCMSNMRDTELYKQGLCHVFVYIANIHLLELLTVSFKAHFVLFLKGFFYEHNLTILYLSIVIFCLKYRIPFTIHKF